MKRKILTMFLALCLSIGMVSVPMESSAASQPIAKAEVNEEEWSWGQQEDGTVSISGYEGAATEVEIPSSLEGKTVTAIGNSAFDGSTVVKVAIPDGVQSIGKWAFSNSSLEEITIPDSVKVIDESAFSFCEKLKSITLPDNLTSISTDTFCYCTSLENIVLPKNLVSIGDRAFEGCFEYDENATVVSGLSSITIPAKVTQIGKAVFSRCKNLKQIEVAEGNEAYTSLEGVLYNKAKTELISYPIGNARKKYEIPAGVQKISEKAFSDAENISEVVFPSSLLEIQSEAFYGVPLEGIALPSGLKTVGERAFLLCGFKEVTIPSSVSEIGVRAFDSSCLTAVNVEPENQAFASEDGILYNKAKTTLLFCPQDKEISFYVVPYGVTEVGESAFSSNYSITNVLLPETVAQIKADAFHTPSLEEITIRNPQCVIENLEEESGSTIWGETKIRGFENSTAQAYAQKAGNPFESIPEGPCQHEYMEQITTPATCTQKGSKTLTCRNCGVRHTEEVPLKGHEYETITTPAAPGKNGNMQKKCRNCGDISSNQTILAPKTLSLSKTALTYNGKAQKVSVTVKDSAGKVIPSQNYSVSYSNNKNVGEAAVTVSLKGKYKGSMKKTFRIQPKGTSLTKVTAGPKGFTAKWKKQASQTTGYEIQYSTSSKFSGKAAKIAKVKKNKTVSQKVSKLKAKKKYYVRIRTYKTVKINGKNTNLYSGWSKVKTVKTKK